ncbi:MAG: ImmA/IrrE family metallo-endopeptidase [Candidatus Humimicrobiaceae bacterium]
MNSIPYGHEKLGDCIFLNSRCTIERRFFTAMHELAHLIFYLKIPCFYLEYISFR